MCSVVMFMGMEITVVESVKAVNVASIIMMAMVVVIVIIDVGWWYCWLG